MACSAAVSEESQGAEAVASAAVSEESQGAEADGDGVSKAIAIITAVIPHNDMVRALLREFFRICKSSDELWHSCAVSILLVFTFKLLEHYETAPQLVRWALFGPGRQGDLPDSAASAARPLQDLVFDMVHLWPDTQLIMCCVNACHE